MSRARVARLAAIVVALAALLALAGCGGSSATATGTAATSATAAGSAAVAASAEASSAPDPSPATTDDPGTTASARRYSDLPAVAAGDLPREAQRTLALIAAGGPFPYDRDGVVFGNREGILPRHARGFYHEYTVRTPGSSDRGARRIVTGEDGGRFYTDDHYASFREVVG